MLEKKDLEMISESVAGIVEAKTAEMQKSLEDSIAQAVEAKMEEKGINKIEKKIFGAAKEVEGLEGKEKVAKFIKALFARDGEAVKAIVGKSMTEGTANDGGVLVPEEFRAEIARIAESFGLFRSLARVIPMRRDTLNLPKVTSSVSVSWPGEATAGTASQPVLGQVQLLSKTLVGITPISNELLEDADVDVVSLLSELFAEAIAGEEDNQGFSGSGSPFTGILNVAGTNLVTMAGGHTSFDDISADYLRDLITKAKVTTLAGAGFYMHPEVWARVQKIKENNQHIASFANPLVTKDAPNGAGVVGYIWGKPVYLTEKITATDAVATKFVIFGNLKYAYLGDRKQVTMTVSEHATIGAANMFESNMSALRVTERVGIVIALPSAFSILKTAAA